MTIGSILLGIALLVVVGLVVLRPFLARQVQQTRGMSRREALQAQKEAVLDRIRELDFDNETGKLPDDEYQRRRRQLLAEAAEILRRLDSLPLAVAPSGNGTQDAEDEIEAAVNALRRVPSPPAGSADDIEAAVKQLRQQRAAATNGPQSPQVVRDSGDGREAGRYCSQCGRPRDAGDRFCAYCGHRFS